MEGTALIVGMIIAIICVAFGYILGAEVTRLSHKQPPRSRLFQDDNTDDQEHKRDVPDGDEWKKGTIYEKGVSDDDDQG